MEGENLPKIKDNFIENSSKKEGIKMEIIVNPSFSEDIFKDVMRLEKESFPPGTAYEDEEEYYRNALNNPQYMNIVAFDEKGKIVGYMLNVPQTDVVKDVKSDDPEIVEDPECVYAETMEIAPNFRGSVFGGKVFARMVNKGVEEAIRRGYLKFCTHARKSIGLHMAIRKYFGDRIIKTREIPKWRWVANEPYEYIEGYLKKE